MEGREYTVDVMKANKSINCATIHTRTVSVKVCFAAQVGVHTLIHRQPIPLLSKKIHGSGLDLHVAGPGHDDNVGAPP